MEKEELYRIHIQRRTEAGEWEDAQTPLETPGFVLLASNQEHDGMESVLSGVTERDIALFLVHMPLFRKVIKQALPAIMVADMLDEQKETQDEMDAEAMLTQLVKRADTEE